MSSSLLSVDDSDVFDITFDASGDLPRGAELRHLSIVGSSFKGRVVDEVGVAGRRAVVTEVTGSAYRTGESTFTLDPDDPLREGFLLR